jgi:CheY-like chemotaxis protein
MPNSPVLIVEDDQDDCAILIEAIREIGVSNELRCFNNGQQALSYLKATHEKTFLILSDVNMPLMDGLELKKEINKDDTLRRRSIPFVFLSTSSAAKEIISAYDMMAQGFFIKSGQFETLKNNLKAIFEYWRMSKHPNTVL